jgi:tRNA modification GTPase
MRAPHSYTTEDSIEIDCHGGVYVMQRILDTVIRNGARPADPGEFTKRAFLNGRIDLTQAESVIDVINSKNEFALQSSLSQLRGSVKKDIHIMREKVLHEIAFIESALDDPEHISLDSYPQQLSAIVDNVVIKMEELLSSSDNGRMRKEGIQTVIMGKPNAGKSSLLNALVGTDKAIVTDIAGTTRDTLEEQINLGGITLNLMDTAGIRSTSDVVEKIGVERAKKYASSADLIIYMVDASTELDENDFEIIRFLKSENSTEAKKFLILLNKSDLKTVTGEEQIHSVIDGDIISISAKENMGIDLLENKIKIMFFNGEINFNDEVYITNMRQKSALMEALESMKLVAGSIKSGMPEDFYSIDLMNAYEALGRIVGESIEDDLVNEIFSKFCMGK